MIKARHFSREIAIQALYQSFVKETPFSLSLDNLWDMIDDNVCDKFSPYYDNIVFPEIIAFWDADQKKRSEVSLYAQELVLGIEEKKDVFYSFLKKNDKTRDIDRLDYPVTAILLVAMYEIMCVSDLDYQISINEAVEFCKKYTDTKSKGYVNSVLQAFVDRGVNG